MLADRFGRKINYVRISVTDRCNFRCVYCMPEEGLTFRTKDTILTYEEIFRLAGIFYQMGVRKFRLTGGEPLVRRELPLLVSMLSSLGPDLEIFMTTNGYFLSSQAQALKDAGLTGLNISLDSLNPERVFQISRRHYLPQILLGIETALKVGFSPIKINTVLIRGINDDEIKDFAAWTRDLPLFVRFIEYMPYRDNQWSLEKMVSGLEISKKLSSFYPSAKWFEGQETDGVSSLVRIPGHQGAIGFINPMTDKFCSTCNRVRLTADGQLRLCLFSEAGEDLRGLLRGPFTNEDIEEAIIKSVFNDKPISNPLPNASQVNVNRYMVEVGG